MSVHSQVSVLLVAALFCRLRWTLLLAKSQSFYSDDSISKVIPEYQPGSPLNAKKGFVQVLVCGYAKERRFSVIALRLPLSGNVTRRKLF
jgi:hypothetical protein